MSDRLHDLRRQRSLAQEQVAWLDREIAAEVAKTGAAVPPSAPVAESAQAAAEMAAAARRSTHTIETTLPADAEKILEQYQTSPGSIKSDVKKGCFLYLALAFGLLALGLVALYLNSRSR